MKRTPIRKMSKAKEKDMRVYRKLKVELLSPFKHCEFPSDSFCLNRAVDIHHERGRVGQMLTDRRYLWLLCREHHNWIHNHTKAARTLGVLK